MRCKAFLFCIIILLSTSCKTEEKPEDVNLNDAPSASVKKLPENYSSDCNEMYNEAKRLDSILLVSMDVKDDLAAEAITAFTGFGYYCSTYSLAPVYLIKSAQVARAVNNIPQAKKSLEFCISEFPEFRDRPAAMFLLAQLYDERTYLNNRDEAQRLYREIIEEYPGSDWAQSARGAMSMVGKSDEEIIRMLKKQN